MSQPRDSDDFLGWAPALGSRVAPLAPPTVTPPQLPAYFAPTPPPSRRAPTRPSGLVTRPPTPTSAQSQARPGQRPASRMRVPIIVATVVMLVFTLSTALRMATEGSQSSPVMLGVFGLVTALLGRVAWVHRRR